MSKRISCMAADQYPNRMVRIVDLETTGLDVESDEILSICIKDLDGATYYSGKFRPMFHDEWPSAMAVNGITLEDVKDCPSFKDCLESVEIALLDGAAVVAGYNHIRFDLPILARYGITIPEDVAVCDLMRDYAIVLGKFDPDTGDYGHVSLKACAGHFGVTQDRPHEADDDVETTRECLISLAMYESKHRPELERIGMEFSTVGISGFADVPDVMETLWLGIAARYGENAGQCVSDAIKELIHAYGRQDARVMASEILFGISDLDDDSMLFNLAGEVEYPDPASENAWPKPCENALREQIATHCPNADADLAVDYAKSLAYAEFARRVTRNVIPDVMLNWIIPAMPSYGAKDTARACENADLYIGNLERAYATRLLEVLDPRNPQDEEAGA